MGKNKKKNIKIAGLVIALVVVLVGGVLFMGAVSGWFESPKVALDAEYYCGDECPDELIQLTPEHYEELIAEKKSFAVVIDQGGCTTAQRLKGYALDYAREIGIEVYVMQFSEMKHGTSMYEKVKYYPSFVIVSKGKVWAFLRADSDDDALMYNDYEAFRDWVGKYL